MDKPLRYADYPPKIRKRAVELASKLYDPKSLDLSAPENQKHKVEVENVLIFYCEEAKKTLRQAVDEARVKFEEARQAAIDAAREAEDAAEEARDTEAEADAAEKDPE